MSFNRLPYDRCAYSQSVKRSVTPGDYRLYLGHGENCKKCLPLNAPINSKDSVSSVRRVNETDFGFLANAESHLTNRTIPLSECNQNATDAKHKTLKLHHKPICETKMESEDTRFSHPVESYRGMSLLNFHFEPYLHTNPQNNVICDSHREGFNSRGWVKDNYKLPEQEKWDKGKALPPKPKKVKQLPKCKVQCN